MSIIEQHRKLVAERVELAKEVVRRSATIESLALRLANLKPSDQDWIRASDKRRYEEERLTNARLELVNIDAKIDQLKFEAQFD